MLHKGALQAYTPGGRAGSLKATHDQIPPACMRLLTGEGARVALGLAYGLYVRHYFSHFYTLLLRGCIGCGV